MAVPYLSLNFKHMFKFLLKQAIYDACASSSTVASATNESGDDSENNSISNGCDNIKVTHPYEWNSFSVGLAAYTTGCFTISVKSDTPLFLDIC